MNALVRIGREIPEIEPWVDREMDAWIRRFAFRMTIYVIGAALVLTALGAVFRVGSRALLIATGVAFVGLVLLVTVSRRWYRWREVVDGMVPARTQIIYSMAASGGFVLLLPRWILEQGSVGFSLGLGMLMVFWGAMLAVHRFGCRVPGPVSCASCAYPIAGLTPECACPECGVWINGPGRATVRVPWRGPWVLPTASVCAALGVLFLMQGQRIHTAVLTALPRSALVTLAIEDYALFEAIAPSLTPNESTGVIETVLDRYSGRWDEMENFVLEFWLEEAFWRGALTRDQVRRMVEEGGEPIRIRAPDRVRVGETVEIGLATDRWSTPVKPRFAFRGFEIDGGLPVEGRKAVLHVSVLRPDLREPWRSRYDPPEVSIEPAHAGEVRVRCVLVLLVPEPGKAVRVRWADDGSWTATPEPVWSETVELEHTITVEPGPEITVEPDPEG